MLDDHAHVMQVKLCKANTRGITCLLHLPLSVESGPTGIYLILPPFTKEYNYDIHADQSNSSLTKFIVNSINIYVFK